MAAMRHRRFLIEAERLPETLTRSAKRVTDFHKDNKHFFEVVMKWGHSISDIRKKSGISKVTIVRCGKNISNPDRFESIQQEIEDYKLQYWKKLNRGKAIYQCLKNDDCGEEILPSHDLDCLRIYANQPSHIDDSSIKLHSWQEELMLEVDKTSERKVIWVYGLKGAEGKSWFQKYVEQCLGQRRVYLGVLTNKADNLAYALSRQLLLFKDIFLFNIARSEKITALQSDVYAVIEAIKDGLYFSGKYSSTQIRFKTPNTVMIFANCEPDYERLSTDRWVVYKILDDLTLLKE